MKIQRHKFLPDKVKNSEIHEGKCAITNVNLSLLINYFVTVFGWKKWLKNIARFVGCCFVEQKQIILFE